MNLSRAPPVIFRRFQWLGNARVVSGSILGRFPRISVIMSRRTGKIRGYSDFCRERNRLRVLLDMDMVLADFEKHFLTKYIEAYPDAPYVKAEDRDGFWLRDQYEKISPSLKVGEVAHVIFSYLGQVYYFAVIIKVGYCKT